MDDLMDLKTGELHIWRATFDKKDYESEKTNPLLSKEEKERCSRYLREPERIRYTCTHRFVREVLARYLPTTASQIQFDQAPMGKPFVKNSGLFFSYSYRTHFGLLAISKHSEVGVDIEKMKPLQDAPTFAAFSFSPKERDLIFASPPDRFQDTLFTFWTFKEAIIKALGVGLNADLTHIDLSDFFYAELNPLRFVNDTVYTVKQIQAQDGYKAAFAIQGKLDAYTEFDYVSK